MIKTSGSESQTTTWTRGWNVSQRQSCARGKVFLIRACACVYGH